MTIKVNLDIFTGGRKVVEIEPKATIGATVGVDLFWGNGTLVTEADFGGTTSDDSDTDTTFVITAWSLLLDIPLNIKELAALTGDGFAYRAADGNWDLRHIGRQVLNYSFGDASPSLMPIFTEDVLVIQTRIVVATALDGAGAALTVGTAATPDLLLSADKVLPSEVGSYDATSNVVLLSGERAQVTITPGAGATAGSGKVVIDTIPLASI